MQIVICLRIAITFVTQYLVRCLSCCDKVRAVEADRTLKVGLDGVKPDQDDATVPRFDGEDGR